MLKEYCHTEKNIHLKEPRVLMVHTHTKKAEVFKVLKINN